MLTPRQESDLTSAGDNFDHWHSSDRAPTQATLHQLSQLTSQRDVTGNYTVVESDDIILCPSAATIAFPLANAGREIEVVMTGTQAVTVSLAGADLIYGEGSVLIEVQGTALRFKAIAGGWVFI